MSSIKLISQYPMASSIVSMDTLIGNVGSGGQSSAISRISIDTLTDYLSAKFPQLTGGANAIQIQSRDISSIQPNNGETLVWNTTAANWEPRIITTTTMPVTATTTVGAITAGEVIGAGVTLQRFIEQLLLKTFYPTYINPSVVLVPNLSAAESGTVGVSLTANFSRGAIMGKLTDGLWQQQESQNPRSGPVTYYLINGVDNFLNNSISFDSYLVQEGPNAFTVTVEFEEGPQPTDSNQNNFETPLLGDVITTTTVVTGGRRAFYGVNNSGATSSDIRSLGSMTSPTVTKGTTFSINVSSGSTSVVFAYPSSLGNVSSVKYVEGLNVDMKFNFDLTTISVLGANNYAGVNYNVYRYAPTGYGGATEPFGSNVTYTVTI